MATQSPFQFLEAFLRNVTPGPGFSPPGWLLSEGVNRIILLLNHVLQQEKEASDRLARQKGRVVLIKWRAIAISLVATPAGLLEKAEPDIAPDLTLIITEDSLLALAQGLLRGDKPGVRIEGDVQLAAEINWLVEHVRWDIEEDLARVIGDVPAHTLGQGARRVVDALRKFTGQGSPGQRAGSPPADAAAAGPADGTVS